MALFIHGADYNKADGASGLLRATGQTIKNGGMDKPYTAQHIRPETFFLLMIQRSVSSGQPVSRDCLCSDAPLLLCDIHLLC